MACFPALAEALGAVKKALAEPQGAVTKAPAEPQGDVTIYGATFNFSARNEIKKNRHCCIVLRNARTSSCSEMTWFVLKKPTVWKKYSSGLQKGKFRILRVR